MNLLHIFVFKIFICQNTYTTLKLWVWDQQKVSHVWPWNSFVKCKDVVTPDLCCQCCCQPSEHLWEAIFMQDSPTSNSGTWLIPEQQIFKLLQIIHPLLIRIKAHGKKEMTGQHILRNTEAHKFDSWNKSGSKQLSIWTE